MNNKKLTLSKSQYVKGLGCALSLWFYRAANNNGKQGGAPVAGSENAQETSKVRGTRIGKLAQDYFPGGVEVSAGWQDTVGAEQETKNLIAAGNAVIFEATAINPNDGTYCSVDVLRKVSGTDKWDMIEVKSSTKVKAYHFDDVTFQRRVFEAAGYKINDCFVMHVDTSYERDGEVDPQKLFKLHDVKRGIATRAKEIDANVAKLLAVIDSPLPPEGPTCSPVNCDTKDKCWPDLPLYSVFNALSFKDAQDVYAQTNSLKIEDIPEDRRPKAGPKARELQAHLTGERHVDKAELQKFLGRIQYPAYYLDFETVMDAVPIYDKTTPYQQVPFQFSLHVQDEPGGPVRHVGFLHKDKTDPRRALAETMIRECGDKGSVIVYYRDFEASRNNELAKAFPDLADKLHAINGRMVDLLDPFKDRWLYDPAQNGSVSLKATLPTYTDISYKGMEISNGEQAFLEYLSFVTGEKTDPAEIDTMWTALDKYCEQDTYAMVALVDEIRRIVSAPEQALSPVPVPAGKGGPR